MEKNLVSKKNLQLLFSSAILAVVIIFLYTSYSSKITINQLETAIKCPEPHQEQSTTAKKEEIILQQIIKQEPKKENIKIDSNCEQIDYGSFVNLLTNKKDKTFLEIGPWANPLQGVLNAKYFDRVDRETIVKAVKTENVLSPGNSDLVPQKIDYVSATGDLGIVKDKFDHVFSRYNVEHQFDLVEHLNKVYDILNDNGKYFAIIPDKRYMFDYFLSDTLLSDVLHAHYVKEKKYSLRVWLQSCERTHINPDLHWNGNHGQDLFDIKTDFSCYESLIKDYLDNKLRTIIEVNSHPWRFYPRSFLFIVDSLNKMGLTKLKVEKIYCTRANELHFYAVLKR